MGTTRQRLVCAIGLLLATLVFGGDAAFAGNDGDRHEPGGSGAEPSRTDTPVGNSLGDQERVVTLLTGDKVYVGGSPMGERIRVVPAPGREHIAFQRKSFGDRQYVVPADAARLVAEGRLDERLFDVSGLIRVGYDDANRSTIPIRQGDETAAIAKRDAASSWKRIAAESSEKTVRLGGQGSDQILTTEQASAQSADGVGVADGAAETYTVTVKHIGRDGEPAFGEDSLLGIDNELVKDGEGETVKLELPEGRYHLNTYIQTGTGQNATTAMMVRPVLTVDRDKTLTIDARTAKLTSIGVEGTNAVNTLEAAYTRYNVGDPDWVYSFSTIYPMWGGPDHVFVSNQGPDAPKSDLVSQIVAQGQERAKNSLYLLAPAKKGHFFNGYDKIFGLDELAKVRESHLPQGDASMAARTAFSMTGGSSIGQNFFFDHPATITSYRTPGAWFDAFGQGEPSNDPEVPLDSDTVLEALTSYPKAQQYEHRWNAAVLNPTVMPSPEEPVAAVGRNGDVIQAAIWPYSDPDGNAGGSDTRSFRNALYRNGELVGETTDSAGWGRFEVSPEPSTYRLEISTRRAANLPYSTKVDTAFTFESEHVPQGNEVWRPLPAWALKFAPPVNERNLVTGGEHELPIRAESVPGSDVGELGMPELQVSYDDGETWTDAPVKGGNGDNDWQAEVNPPADAKFVSLKVKATDSKGNVFEQTVIRAYGLT